MSLEEVPIVVKLLVGYEMFTGILCVVAAIIIGLVGVLLGALGDLGALFGPVAVIGAVGLGILGVAEIILALALLHLKKWAWWVNLILFSLYVLSGLWSLMTSGWYVIGILINLAVVIYLLRIRKLFGVKENVL